MPAETGNLSIHAQNLLPIIKKWLYSDKDIFLRELVSNACDAITKYQKIARVDEDEEFSVHVSLDKELGTLTISDNGIGMTADEVKQYINQVAFSGAEAFLEKYKDKTDASGIIGHFGLGFYSAFMVASRVRIDTLSFEEGATPCSWESEGGLEYTMDESDLTTHGTYITLFISDEEKEFLEEHRVREVLKRYCGFMPIPVFFEIAGELPEGAEDADAHDHEGHDHDHEGHDHDHEGHDHDHEGHDHDHEGHDHDHEGHDHEGHDHVPDAETPDAEKAPEPPKGPKPINDTHPLFLKAPRECTDEEYKEFYRTTFATFEEPLFWIHLNVDYPFNLKGILYFPRLRRDMGPGDGQVRLYSNQVFVAENIKEVIPEFLLLLKGVIDCPDLPLNVSRSFLQNDGYVQKLSAHITKKVADRLTGMFNTEREQFEKYWDDIHPFIKYGCIRDDSFYDKVKDVLLFTTTDKRHLTLEEVKKESGDKHGDRIFYTNDAARQAAFIEMYTAQGIPILTMQEAIDSPFMQHIEMHEGKLRFTRVDAELNEVVKKGEEGSQEERDRLKEMFEAATGEKITAKLESLANAEMPALLLQEEQARRYTEWAKNFGGDMGFSMPVERTLVLNRNNPLITSLLTRTQDEDTLEVCRQVYDIALLESGDMTPEGLTKFVNRSRKMLDLLSKNWQ